ncbi:hypothetical protein U1839_25245 [Sphingomonas sp. RT2P30]
MRSDRDARTPCHLRAVKEQPWRDSAGLAIAAGTTGRRAQAAQHAHDIASSNESASACRPLLRAAG